MPVASNGPPTRVPVQEQRREQRDAAGAGDPLAVAQPPHQAGAAAAARAASSVLRSSIAIVIGPTPRGTGVMQPRALGRGVEVDVADQPVVGAVDADVDHRRALLDPVALHHPRAPDRGDEHVGAAAHVGQVARARVADGHGRVAREQHLRDRLADEVRAADHDRLGALQLDAVAVEQLHAPRPACTAAAPAGPWPAARRRPA